MLIPQLPSIEVLLVLGIEYLLEDVSEVAIILLQDRVLGSEIDGHVPGKGISERLIGKVHNRLIGVVHCQSYTSLPCEFEHLSSDGLPILRSEHHLQLPWLVHLHVLALILITIRVSSNHDGVRPSRYQLWDVLAHDGLSEHSPIQHRSDCTIRGGPHLLQFELLHSPFVSSDCSAFYTNFMFFNSIRRIHCHFIVSLVTVLH